MSDRSAARRLIESAFPLKEASIDSVHEKNVRHGHISTLHVWPARRPLAASRAVLLATLLDDPGGDGRKDLLRRIAGDVVKKKGEHGEKEETIGGVLHWGRESSTDLTRFRDEIREAFGGRAPRVLDPFAGGGAIPLEAMRLGCEVTASDLNPVAWFILRCTLHYPRLMAGQTRPLPDFVLRDRIFVEAFLEAQGIKRKNDLRSHLARLGHDDGLAARQTSFDVDLPERNADFPWHLRAWGQRVLAGARRELAPYYPTYAEFEPLKRKGRRGKSALPPKRFKPRAQKLLPLDEHGQVSVDHLNAEFDSLYLEDPRNPRWVAKPAVAYLWARTATCGDCRAEIPLLKTRWLCNRDNKRVLLKMIPREDRSGVEFGVECDVPDSRDDAALGAGTMSRSGATCPVCDGVAMMEELQAQGVAGRLGARMTAVVVDGQEGKEYRLPDAAELEAGQVSREYLQAFYAATRFGIPIEATPKSGAGASRAFSVHGYGLTSWDKLFSHRQLLALGTFTKHIRQVQDEMEGCGYSAEWRESLVACLTPSLSRLADRCSTLATWTNDHDKIRGTFARFALPMVWDFAESCPLTDTTGGFGQAVEWIARVCSHAQQATAAAPPAIAMRQSAIDIQVGEFDVICTDPPYYDAIPYSDLMDFFHVWLRRALHGHSPETDAAFADPLGPKWDAEKNDGELIDDASRFGGNRATSKQSYEDGMARAFSRFHGCLRGRWPIGHRICQQAAGRLGDPGIRADQGRIRRDRLLAHQNREAEPPAFIVVRRTRILHLDRMQETFGSRPCRLGQASAGRDAKEHHQSATGILGRRHPRPRLRLGRHRSGTGSVQPPSRREDHRCPRQAAHRGRVPAPRSAHGRRIRRQPPAESGQWPRRRAGRLDDLLSPASQRLRSATGAGRRQHPLRAVLQPLGFGLGGTPEHPGPQPQAPVRKGRRRRQRRSNSGDARWRSAARGVESTSRQEPRRAGRERCAAPR